MSQQLINQLEQNFSIKAVEALRPGFFVKVHQSIKEGEKQRIQIFEGLVMRLSGSGIGKTVTVRKIVDGVGVEKIFPLHSPMIKKIDILKQGKVRKARLYFMRKRAGKSTRLRERKKDELSAMVGNASSSKS